MIAWPGEVSRYRAIKIPIREETMTVFYIVVYSSIWENEKTRVAYVHSVA